MNDGDAPDRAASEFGLPGETGESTLETGAPEVIDEPERPRTGAARVARIAAVAAGAIFIGALGILAVRAFTGDRAGADAPEAVVEAMATAASSEDVLGMLALLPPSEVGTFAEIYPDVMEWASREGHVAGGDLLAGLDIDISGLDVEATLLHPDVAIVELRAGTVTVAADPETADPWFVERFGPGYSSTVDELLAEVQERVRESQDDVVGLGLGGLFELQAPDSLHVMTIRREGRWYLSPLYSVAEFARRIADLPEADFMASRANARPGAPNASAVMGDFVDMLNRNRFEDYLAAETFADLEGERSALNIFVPPDELGAVLDYATAYEELLNRASEGEQRENLWEIIDDLGLEIRGGISIEINTREEPGPGDAVVLFLSSGSINATAEVTVIETGEVQPWEIQVSWNGLCTTGYTQIYDDRDDFDGCIEPEDWPGDDEPFLVVREVDGTWYISYVETAIAYIELFLDDYLDDGASVGVQST